MAREAGGDCVELVDPAPSVSAAAAAGALVVTRSGPSSIHIQREIPPFASDAAATLLPPLLTR